MSKNNKVYTTKEDFEKSLLPKEPRTIKVRTVVISVAVFIALIASFIAGTIAATHYTDTVHAQAIELSLKLKK